MKHLRLVLSVLFLILMFVPAQAQKLDPKQKIDPKAYYLLTAGTVEGENLSINEVKPGKYALSLKTWSEKAREPGEYIPRLWRFVDVGKGFFRIINASQPLMSLELANKTNLTLAKTKDVLGQHWKLSPLFDGFRLTNRLLPGKCLTATIEDNPKVVLRKNANGGSDQRFAFEKSYIRADSKTDIRVQMKIDERYYYRLKDKASVGTSTDNWVLGLRVDQEGIKPELSEPSEAASQLWRFVDLGNGFFRLINASQPLMSVENVQSKEMASYRYMALSKTSESIAQQWKISPNGNGFRLSNRGQADQSIESTEMGTRLEKTGKSLGQVWMLNQTDITVDKADVAKADAVVEDKFELTSTSFVNGERIPFEYTGQDGISPPLAWKGAPAGTKSFMIICSDPDAPSPANPGPNPFVHWFVLNIPAETKYLLTGVPRLENLSTPFGAQQHSNDFGEMGYSGPKPPKGSGKHRYFFAIYAMDRVHVLDPKLSPEFIKTLQRSVLAKAELMGTYEIPASLIQGSNVLRK